MLDAAPIVDAVVDTAPPAADADPGDSSGHINGSFAVNIRTDRIDNCTRAGADMTEIRVALVDSAGTCIPATFRLLGTVGPVPPLTEARSLCPSTPAKFSCFETDIPVSVQGLAPGGYHLVVDGIVGDRTCWKGDASIGVSDVPDEQTLTLLKQDGC